MSERISVGGIEADIVLNSGNLDQDLAAIQRGMSLVAAETRILRDQFDAGAKTFADFQAELGHLNATQDALRQKAREVEAAIRAQTTATQAATATTSQAATATTVLTASQGNASKASAHLGRAMMQLNYTVDDIRFGFGAIINNIGPMAQSFGQAAGMTATAATSMAAGVQMAALAGFELYTHWDKLEALFGISKVQTEAEQMDELGKKTGRTADETERLNKHKKEQHEIAMMMEAKTSGQRDLDKDVLHSITEAGSDKVKKGIFESLRANGRGAKLTPERRAALRLEVEKEEGLKTWDFGTASAVEKRAKARREVTEEKVDKRAEKELSKEDAKRAVEMMNNARHDPAALKGLMSVVDKSPGAFPDGFGASLAGQVPENKKRKDEWLRQQKGAATQWTWDEQERKKNEREEAKGERSSSKKRQEALGRDRETAKERDELAHTLMPGLDKDVEKNIAIGKVIGMPMDQVAKQLEEALVSAGMGNGKIPDGKGGFIQAGENDAKAEAAKLMAEGEQGVNEKIAKKMQGREGMAEKSRSEVYDTADLTRRIQGSISNTDDSKKKVPLMEQMLDRLDTMAKANGPKIEVT